MDNQAGKQLFSASFMLVIAFLSSERKIQSIIYGDTTRQPPCPIGHVVLLQVPDSTYDNLALPEISGHHLKKAFNKTLINHPFNNN